VRPVIADTHLALRQGVNVVLLGASVHGCRVGSIPRALGYRASWQDRSMDVARLVLEYIQALVWPAVVVMAAWMFKDALAERVSALRKLTLPGGIEAELDEAKQELAELREQIPDDAPELRAKAEAAEARVDDAREAVYSAAQFDRVINARIRRNALESSIRRTFEAYDSEYEHATPERRQEMVTEMLELMLKGRALS
jgi:hypothetical protein